MTRGQECGDPTKAYGCRLWRMGDSLGWGIPTNCGYFRFRTKIDSNKRGSLIGRRKKGTLAPVGGYGNLKKFPWQT